LWRFGVAKVAKVERLRSKVVWLALLIVSVGACHTPTEKKHEPEVVWHRIGTWSGVGSLQTESFESGTGSLRVQWKTTNETAPGQGTFRLAFHSSISGRELQVAVDRKGTGADTAYVQQDPHVFFAKVESANLEWSFTVDEAVTTR
jgi:hypothetical protein